MGTGKQKRVVPGLVDVSVSPQTKDMMTRVELSACRRIFRRMAAAVSLSRQQSCEWSVLLTTDVAIQQLNKQWRQVDSATDVLAFALQETMPTSSSNPTTIVPVVLGDVIISIETAQRQRQDRSLLQEIVHLGCHGLCHLLGYDHYTRQETADMNRRMNSLLVESLRTGPVIAA